MGKSIPGVPTKPCTGSKQSKDKAQVALLIVGRSIELAVNLRIRVDVLTKSERPPIAPYRPDFVLASWEVLAAYLIEERRLIEFLLGPGISTDKGVLRYRYSNDICLDCFTPTGQQPWRFTNTVARDELAKRADRINQRLTHFSWTLTKSDRRSDDGLWSTHYLDQITNGLELFAQYLETNGSSALANVLRHPLKPEANGSTM